MNIFPYQKQTYLTGHDIDHVKNNLIARTEPWQNQAMRTIRGLIYKKYTDSTKFEIKMYENKFVLRRINDRYSNNGSRPLVIGNINRKDKITQIELSITQHIGTRIALIISSIITIGLAFLSIGESIKMTIGFLGLFSLIYIGNLFLYNSEMRFYKQFLSNTFNN